MNSSSRQNIVLFIVVFLGSNFQVVSYTLESLDKKPTHIATDVLDLLQNFGPSVTNNQGRGKLDEFSDTENLYEMYRDYGKSKKNEKLMNSPLLMTQKNALRDVLMMKLVSYYEDKYKLSRTSVATTRQPAPMRRFREPARTNIVDPIPTKQQVFYNTKSTYSQEPYIANYEEVIII